MPSESPRRLRVRREVESPHASLIGNRRNFFVVKATRSRSAPPGRVVTDRLTLIVSTPSRASMRTTRRSSTVRRR